MKIKKWTFGIIFALIITMFSTILVLGDELNSMDFEEISARMQRLEEELQRNSELIENTKNLMTDVEDKIEEVNIVIEKYDNEIFLLDEKVKGNKDVLAKLEQEKSLILDRLNKEEEILNKNKEIYSKQVKFLYVNGIPGQLKLIFSAENWESFISYITFIKNLNNYNEELFHEISSSIDIINHEKNVLVKNENAIKLMNEKILGEKDIIEEKKKEQIKIVKKSAEEKKKYRAMLQEYGIQNTIKEKMIKDIKSRFDYMLQKKNDLGMKEDVGEKLVEYASLFLGDPYKWGGTRPYDGTYGSGFDCSGFVQYCFRKFGVEVGRNTYQQIDDEDGVYVEREKLRIGDVVFFGSRSAPHHVGIYIGDNAYIHSPQTGDVIKISKMTRSDYAGARRFLNK